MDHKHNPEIAMLVGNYLNKTGSWQILFGENQDADQPYKKKNATVRLDDVKNACHQFTVIKQNIDFGLEV